MTGEWREKGSKWEGVKKSVVEGDEGRPPSRARSCFCATPADRQRIASPRQPPHSIKFILITSTNVAVLALICVHTTSVFISWASLAGQICELRRRVSRISGSPLPFPLPPPLTPDSDGKDDELGPSRVAPEMKPTQRDPQQTVITHLSAAFLSRVRLKARREVTCLVDCDAPTPLPPRVPWLSDLTTSMIMKARPRLPDSGRQSNALCSLCSIPTGLRSRVREAVRSVESQVPVTAVGRVRDGGSGQSSTG